MTGNPVRGECARHPEHFRNGRRGKHPLVMGLLFLLIFLEVIPSGSSPRPTW